MSTLEQTYERTIELTEQNVNEDRYRDPAPIVRDMIEEIDQLEELKLINSEIATEWRYRMYFLICGS